MLETEKSQRSSNCTRNSLNTNPQLITYQTLFTIPRFSSNLRPTNISPKLAPSPFTVTVTTVVDPHQTVTILESTVLSSTGDFCLLHFVTTKHLIASHHICFSFPSLYLCCFFFFALFFIFISHVS